MESNPAAQQQMSGKAMAKANKQAEQKAIYDAMAARAEGQPVSADQSRMLEQDKASRDARKAELTSAGIGAVGGLASGALQALLSKGGEKSRASIPGGGAGNIQKAGSPEVNMQRASINAQDRPSLALEMLRRGGYK